MSAKKKDSIVGRFVSTNGIWYTVALAVIGSGFVAVKIGMPLLFDGSYIDEYLHIFGGLQLFDDGRLAEFYEGQGGYARGTYVTALVGALLELLGQSLFVAKLVPALVGVINFVLAYRIARQTVEDPKYVLLFLVIYTVSPWVLFNHFYLRFYVFYELFLLVLITLGIRALAALVVGDWKRLGLVVVAIGALNGFALALSDDKGAYLILLATAAACVYLFVFETGKLPVPSGTAVGRFLGRVLTGHSLVRAGIVVGFVAIGMLALPVGELFELLLRGNLTNTSAQQFKYDTFFFKQNVLFTVLFVLSCISIFVLRDGRQRLLVWIAAVLFVMHLVSSEDLQITRGILYFMPLFYLVPFVSLSQIEYPSNRLICGFFAVVMVASTLHGYPDDFRRTPRIPSEIHYVDYAKLYLAVSEQCSGALVVDASPSAFIARFYGVELDYVMVSKRVAKRDAMFRFDETSRRFRLSLDETPVIVDWRPLEGERRDVCLIVRKVSARSFLPRKVAALARKSGRYTGFENIGFYRIEAEARDE